MQFGLDIAQQRVTWAELQSRAQFAEDLGFTGVWGFDHFRPMYGEGPGECFEGNTTLAALSGHTRRVRLGLLMTGMTYRHPSVMALEAITIDHASGGRYDIGYGAAWFEPEHTDLGIPFPGLRDRIDAFEEAVQIVRGLLTTDGFTFGGRFFSVEDATLRPRPVQRPHPPLWIGASGEKRMLPIAARFADVWHGHGTVEEMQNKSRVFDGLAEQHGRDPSSIGRASSLSLEGEPDAVSRGVESWSAAGFDYLVCGWPSGGRSSIEAFVKRQL